MTKSECYERMAAIERHVADHQREIDVCQAKAERLDNATRAVSGKLEEFRGASVRDVYDLETCGDWSGQRRNDITDIAGGDLKQQLRAYEVGIEDALEEMRAEARRLRSTIAAHQNAQGQLWSAYGELSDALSWLED